MNCAPAKMSMPPISSARQRASIDISSPPAGFRPWTTFGLKIPNLFHPLELREPSSTPLMYWSCEDVSELADLLKLYITKKDIDFDRPVFSTLQ